MMERRGGQPTFLSLSVSLSLSSTLPDVAGAESTKDKLGLPCNFSVDFPGGSDGKASARNAGDLGSIPGSGKVPWRRKWQPTPVLLPGKFHGQKSLVEYSPWGRRVGHN